MPSRPVLILLVALMATSLATTLAVAQAVGRIEFVRVPHRGVRFGDKAGNVVWVSPSGNKRRLTTDGLASDAKASPDGRTVAWIAGQILRYPNKDLPPTKTGYRTVPTYFPAAILVWREDRRPVRIVPEKLYEVRWAFRKNGDQIAAVSEGSHGLVYYQLFDSVSGKQVERIAWDGEAKLPVWCEGLSL